MWHCDVVSMIAADCARGAGALVQPSLSNIFPTSCGHLFGSLACSALMCVLLLAHLVHGILLGCFAARARARSLIGSGPGLIPL